MSTPSRPSVPPPLTPVERELFENPPPRKPHGGFIRFKTQWLKTTPVAEVEVITGDEPIPAPGKTVKRGSKLGNHLSDIWKGMTNKERRPFVEEAELDRLVYEEDYNNWLSTISRAAREHVVRKSADFGGRYSMGSQATPQQNLTSPIAYNPEPPFPALKSANPKQIKEARKIIGLAEKAMHKAGEQGLEMGDAKFFTQRRLARSKKTRNFVWMQEIFGRSIGSGLESSRVKKSSRVYQPIIQKVEERIKDIEEDLSTMQEKHLDKMAVRKRKREDFSEIMEKYKTALVYEQESEDDEEDVEIEEDEDEEDSVSYIHNPKHKDTVEVNVKQAASHTLGESKEEATKSVGKALAHDDMDHKENESSVGKGMNVDSQKPNLANKHEKGNKDEQVVSERDKIYNELDSLLRQVSGEPRATLLSSEQITSNDSEEASIVRYKL